MSKHWRQLTYYTKRSLICVALHYGLLIFKVLGYATYQQGIRQFYLPPMFIHSGMSHTCHYSPAADHHHTLAGTHFPSHWEKEAELAWVAWWNTDVVISEITRVQTWRERTRQIPLVQCAVLTLCHAGRRKPRAGQLETTTTTALYDSYIQQTTLLPLTFSYVTAFLHLNDIHRPSVHLCLIHLYCHICLCMFELHSTKKHVYC